MVSSNVTVVLIMAKPMNQHLNTSKDKLNQYSPLITYLLEFAHLKKLQRNFLKYLMIGFVMANFLYSKTLVITIIRICLKNNGSVIRYVLSFIYLSFPPFTVFVLISFYFFSSSFITACYVLECS